MLTPRTVLDIALQLAFQAMGLALSHVDRSQPVLLVPNPILFICEGEMIATRPSHLEMEPQIVKLFCEVLCSNSRFSCAQRQSFPCCFSWFLWL